MTETLLRRVSDKGDIAPTEREMAQRFAPRVDTVVEQLGADTTKIGEVEYQLSSSGTTTSVTVIQDFLIDGNVYPYRELLRVTVPSSEGIIQTHREITVGSPTFAITQSGEIALGDGECIRRMNGFISTVESAIQVPPQIKS
jgi:hypothetical protein